MSDKQLLFKYTKLIMLFSGLWNIQNKNDTNTLKLIYKIYSFTLKCVFSSILVSFAIEFCIIYSTDIDGAVVICSRFIYIFLLIVKANICQSNRMKQLLLIALREEQNLYENEHKTIRNIYQNHVKYCFNVTITIFVTTFALFFYLTELGIAASYRFYQAHKYSKEALEKPLPAPVWYPFDRNKHHIYALAYQILETFLTALYSGSVHTLTNSVIIFLRAQLRILQYQFTNFNRPFLLSRNEEKPSISSLKEFCKKHQQLISWIKDLNESMRKILLLEYSVSSLLIAAVLIQILQGDEVMFNIIYFSLIFGQLTMLSLNSDEISSQSINLSSALYNSKWYEEDHSVQVLSHIIIMRCQKPLTLSIGSFGPMTANAALSRIKLAYSYVSLFSAKT